MNSIKLATVVGCNLSYIQKLTKEAMDQGKSEIVVRGELYRVSETKGRGGSRGKVYHYTPLHLPTATPKSRRRGSSYVDMAALEGLGVDIVSPSAEDRMAVVRYVVAHPEYSMTAVAHGFSLMFGIEDQTKSIERKIRRWIKAYKDGGKEALVDKRGGGKGEQTEHELFLKSIVKRGGLHVYYLRYCAMWCSMHGEEMDIWEPRSNVSYSAFSRYFYKHQNDVEVKMLLRGMDAVEESVPVFSTIAQLSYPNQRWEIDATRLDIMVRVPVINGVPEYFRPVQSDEYIVTRYTLNGVFDSYSSARVYKLMKSGTSYGNARVIEKAINTLGVPEMIKGDNGKDYVSEHFQALMSDIGIVYEAATPYKGSEKGGVERGFRSLQHDARFEVLPGYIGHSVDQRQDIESQAVKKSQRGGKGVQTNLSEELMWWWDAERVMDGLIAKLYAEQMRLHQGEICTSREIPDLHQRLGKSGKRRLQRTGVQWNGAIYTSTALWDRYRIGDMVTVREEIDDIGIIYLEDERGEFVTLSSDRASISLEEAMEAKRAYRKQHTAKIKQIVSSAKSEAAKLGELTVAEAQKQSDIPLPQIIKLQEQKKPVNNQKEADRAMREIMRVAGY